MNWVALAAAAASASASTGTSTEDIHDIRGPKMVLQESSVLTLAIIAALLVGITLFLIWRRRRNRAGTGVARILTLSEQTLAALEKAKQSMRPDTAREFGIATSEVIRTYIERRFQIVATQRTTEEFLQTLAQGSNEALSRHRALLEEFLNQCDIVKFAGASPAVTELEPLYASARRFVLETSETPAAKSETPSATGETRAV
jgi:LPXTG-motif cell wall-anchored protein